MSLPEETLTTKDVCRVLHCDRRSVYNWRKRGLLTGHVVGRRLLFDKAEVEALWESFPTDEDAHDEQ